MRWYEYIALLAPTFALGWLCSDVANLFWFLRYLDKEK
jgi:hypothetical protein